MCMCFIAGATCYNGTTLGKDYIGTVNVTRSGLTCAAWSNPSPHT